MSREHLEAVVAFKQASMHLVAISATSIQKDDFVSIKGLTIHHPIKLYCFWLQQQHLS